MAHSDYFSQEEKEQLCGDPEIDFIIYQRVVRTAPKA